MSTETTAAAPAKPRAKGGKPSEYAGKTYGIIAEKSVIKAYKTKSPAVDAAIKTILASKKKAPKVSDLLGTDVEHTGKDGNPAKVKIGTVHFRRAIAEKLIAVA